MLPWETLELFISTANSSPFECRRDLGRLNGGDSLDLEGGQT